MVGGTKYPKLMNNLYFETVARRAAGSGRVFLFRSGRYGQLQLPLRTSIFLIYRLTENENGGKLMAWKLNQKYLIKRRAEK